MSSRDTADASTSEPSLGDVETVLGDEIVSGGRARQTLGLDAGAKVGRYVILERLGEGGMGVVYAAYDPELDRKIALKVLKPRHNRAKGSTGGRNRLAREAQALAKLSHPNVIGVYDVGAIDAPDGTDRIYIATEFVDGEDLAAWLRRQRSEDTDRSKRWRRVVEIFVAAGRGLAAAHDAGIVHRDFKPQNVLVGRDSVARVVDFGLARTEPSAPISPVGPPGGEDERVCDQPTLDGPVAGTPAYMAPEQLGGSRVGPLADQFSFCVALYEALYDKRPFAASTMGALLYETTEGKVEPPPPRSGVPARLRRIVMRGLAPNPDDRYPSMGALLADLEYDPRARLLRAAGIVGIVGLVAAVGYAGWAYTRPGMVAVSVSAGSRPLDDAEVWIGDHRLEPADGGARGEVPAGLYAVHVTAPEHEPFSDVIEVNRGGVHELAVTMEHETGLLDLTVEPHDAVIHVDGVDHGSRLVDLRLDTGEHRVLVTREGGYEIERTYRIESARRVSDFVYSPKAVRWSAAETGVILDILFLGDTTGDHLPEVLHRSFNNVSISDPWNDRPVWRASLGSTHHQLMATADVDGDGVLDIVATHAGLETNWVAIWTAQPDEGLSPTTLWKRERPTNSLPSPVGLSVRPFVVFDETHDTRDVLVADLWGAGRVTAHRGTDGRSRWSFDAGSSVVGMTELPSTGPQQEIVVVTQHGLSIISAANGKARWSVDVDLHFDEDALHQIQRHRASRGHAWPVAVPSDDHGAVIVVQTKEREDAIGELHGYAADDGGKLWSISDIDFRRSPEVRPLGEGGGTPQVLVIGNDQAGADLAFVVDALDGSIRLRQPAGRAAWVRWSDDRPGSLATVSGDTVSVWDPDSKKREAQIRVPAGITASPVIADLDGNGVQDIVVADAQRRVRAFAPDGTQVVSSRMAVPARRLWAVGDVDDDGFDDVLADANGPVVLVGPKIRWARRTRDAVRAAPLVADFDSDGSAEVAAFGGFTDLEGLHLFDGRTGNVEHVSDRADVIRTPLPVPRDDGGTDILALDFHTRAATVFSGRDASRLHAFDLQAEAYGTPGFGDVDGDGVPELIALPWNRAPLPVVDTRAWTTRWSYDAPEGSWATPYIGDLDADGRPEVLVGFHNGTIAAYRGKDPQPIWSVSLGPAKINHVPTVADLDGDGRLELLAAGTGSSLDLLILDASTGREIRRLPGLGNPNVPTVVGDVDEDGNPDLFVVADTSARRIDADGQVVWSHPLPLGPWGAPSRGLGPAQLADLEADKSPELVVSTSTGVLVVLDAIGGSLLWRFETENASIEGGPVVADIDADGIAEVLLGSHDRHLYCLRTPLRRK